jgi:hypothetical protein
MVDFAFEMRFRDFAREHQIRPDAFERRDLRWASASWPRRRQRPPAAAAARSVSASA